MTKQARPCVDCGILPTPEQRRFAYGRCPDCAREYRKRRARDPIRRAAYNERAFREFSLEGKECEVCGTTEDLTRDHIIPLARGGTAADGLRVLCRMHNSRRGAGTLHEELTYAAVQRLRNKRIRELINRPRGYRVRVARARHMHKVRAYMRARAGGTE